MNIDIDFFKRLYDNDIIYHYTKASTAIDFILYNNELRFNKARQLPDPIESRTADRRTVYSNFDDNLHTKELNKEENELHNSLYDIESRFNLVCFCKNSMGSDFANKNYSSFFGGYEEFFGFTKLRMWDQYADKFLGVCIAFSQKKILSINCKKFDLICDEVKYLKFQELSLKKVGDISANYLLKVGKEKYQQELKQRAMESFFYKHIDYAGEDEYRIGTLFDKDKCGLDVVRDELFFDSTMMLDIAGCIEAIFISSFVNDKQKQDLLRYANKLNVEIVEMKWKHDSFEPRDFRGWSELLEEFHKNRHHESSLSNKSPL